MGIFSPKTTITVSSTLYNMAGDEENRPDYLKGTLFSSVMADSPSLSDDITNSYFEGPGLKQRQFFNYANRNNIAGMPTVSVTNTATVDMNVVAGQITLPVSPPAPSGLSIVMQNAYVTNGDPDVFIEKWILENYPTRIAELWTGDVNGTSFSVQFPNGDFYSWTDSSFDVSARYITAAYVTILESNTQAWVNGTPTSVSAKVDLTGWNTDSQSGTFTPVTLQRQMVVSRTYSDSRPDEFDPAVNADVGVNLNTSIDVYSRQIIIDANLYEIASQNQKYTYTGSDSVVTGYSNAVVTEVLDIGNGVIRTTTETTTGEQVSITWNEEFDTQEVLEGTVYGSERRFIYKVGSGNAVLDALALDKDASGYQEFYPFLPLRLDNTSISDAAYTSNGLYDETKKAYRRATTKSFDKIVSEVEDNPSIGDIDYAYVMWGCSLNVQENACRKYIYNFFKEMQQFQTATTTTMSEYQAQVTAYEDALVALDAWEATVNGQTNQDYSLAGPRPVIPNISNPTTTTLKLQTNSSLMPSYDIRLNWVFIEETVHSGTFTFHPVVGAARNSVKGELELVDGPSLDFIERTGIKERGADYFTSVSHSIPSMEIYWQISDTQYRKLTIHGLVHENYVYGGKAVVISSKEALADTDISGFIVPLHSPTMKAMSIVDYTQMATADMHILFNSYEITKQKWYQTLLFKILLIILIIVLVVVIAPGGFAAGSGILGGNVAIGSALGLTGTAAIVAGVVANYLASIVISQVLSVVGRELFGEKWGALFSALVGFALTMEVSGAALFSAQGILGLSGVLANGYAGYVQADIDEMSTDFQQEQNQYEKQMDYINDLLSELGNDLNFNPLSLTSTTYGNGRSGSGGGYMPETADEFIRRTTMTGTDVIDITQSMVHDFVEIQQTLPRN